MDPASIERTQSLLERGPITFVAALFCCAFVLTFLVLLRAERRHAQDLAKLHEESRELHVKVATAIGGLLDLTEDVRFLAHEGRRRARRSSAPTPTAPPSEGEE